MLLKIFKFTEKYGFLKQNKHFFSSQNFPDAVSAQLLTNRTLGTRDQSWAITSRYLYIIQKEENKSSIFVTTPSYLSASCDKQLRPSTN